MKNFFQTVILSSIIRKQIVALTGLLLCGFVTLHLIGNLLMFLGHRAFNLYAHQLTSTPLIYGAEVLLALIFLTHLIFAIKLNIENLFARGDTNYFIKQKTGRGATLASSTMPYTGLIILIFVILHIKALKFGNVYWITYDGMEVRDLFRTCLEYFSHPLAVIWYVFSMAVVSMHLYHGFWSLFQSLGCHHPKYTPILQKCSQVYAIVIGIGFSTLPIYCYALGKV